MSIIDKRKKEAPTIPQMTCESIDTCIRHIREGSQEKAIEYLETLRTSNVGLRESSHYRYQRCKELYRWNKPPCT